VTVIGMPDLLSVNVVADCGRIELPKPVDVSGVLQQTITDHETLWVEVRWAIEPSPR
jgi:hypothetical protein